MWMLHDTLHTFLEAHDDRLEVVHRLQLASKASETKQSHLMYRLHFSCWTLRTDSITVGFGFDLCQSAYTVHHGQCTRFQ